MKNSFLKNPQKINDEMHRNNLLVVCATERGFLNPGPCFLQLCPCLGQENNKVSAPIKHFKHVNSSETQRPASPANGTGASGPG